MHVDSVALLLAFFGAFALGFFFGLMANALRRLIGGVWRAPGRVARGLSRFGTRLREKLHPLPRRGVAGLQEEIPLPAQPISRAVALFLTFPLRRAQQLFQMAEEALAAGHDRIAEGHYLTALFWDRRRSLPPLHVQANLRLGQIRAARGDIEGAIVAYERVRDLEPGNVEAYLELGQLYFRAGEAGQALYELGRALELDPDNLDVRYHLFQIYQQSGMLHEATRQLRLLKAGEEPGLIAALFLRHGQEHFRQASLDLAATDYRLVLELDPQQEEAIWSLGDILRRQGHREEALHIWTRGLWVAPSPALDERLSALAREGFWEPVVLAYQRASLLRPRDGRILLALGDLARERGLNEEALGYWQQAAATQPELVEAHLRLEEHYQQAGEQGLASQHLRAALQSLWGRETVYRCRSCGHLTPVEQPYCFACEAWDAFTPLPRGELQARAALVPRALGREARAVVQRLGGWWGKVRNFLLGPGQDI